MKILCVIDSLGPGGAQRQLVELAIGFKEMGHDVSFLVYHDIPFYNDYLKAYCISTTCIEEPGYMIRLLKMRHFIRNSGFDSVLSFLEAPSFICEFAGIPKRNWKLVVGERRANPDILKSMKLVAYRWFHLFTDYVVSNSQLNINYVTKANPFLLKSRTRVIYNIVNMNRWNLPTPGFRFKKNGVLKLIIAASHIHRKNAVGLIEALSLLTPEEQNKVVISWYGDNITEPFKDSSFLIATEKIKEYRLGEVISFHPATHDITEIIKESDAVGLFSFSEGLPNIVCEGMACGKPILCPAISDLPDLLSDNSKLMFNPADTLSIRNALRYLINLSEEDLQTIGLQNYLMAKQKFNKERIVGDYINLLTN